MNIDIVVQGNYFDSIANGMSTSDICNHYSKFSDHVILSTYEQYKEKPKNLNKNIEVVYSDDNQETQYNPNNLYWHTKSTIRGLEEVRTRLCLKTRTDEYHEDLSVIIDNVDKKYITSNICAQYWNNRRFHLSDHIILCETDPFLSILIDIKKVLLNSNDVANKWMFLNPEYFNLPELPYPDGVSWGAEMIFCYKYLEKLNLINKYMHIDEYKIVVQNNCKIIPISDFGKNSLVAISKDRIKQWWTVDQMNKIDFCNRIEDL